MHDKVKKGRYIHENKKNVYVIWKIIWYLKREKMYFNVSKSTYYILEFNSQKFSLNFNIRLYCIKK